ncbi:putative SUI1/eIF-1 [Chlorella virus XW01]|nr:putative SUI1/eIF-1 [Chlorella virus XW01]
MEFEDNTNNNNFDDFDNIIINPELDLFQKEKEHSTIFIWNRKNKRTINTYLVGWEPDDLKDHHRTLKKKFNCNGSLKKGTDINNNENLILHLSCDCVNDLVKYLISNGIDKELINIKN